MAFLAAYTCPMKSMREKHGREDLNKPLLKPRIINSVD
jgi:hypothetical protein